MKIGIMTFFRPVNFGAYLQAYALSHRLNMEEDITAELIDFRMPAEVDAYTPRLGRNIPKYIFAKKKHITFERAISQQIHSSDSVIGGMEEFPDFVRGKYDVIIAGSDEIWRVDGYRGFPTPYFLPEDLQCRKFSYAASSRNLYEGLEPYQIEMLEKLWNDFEYIGVRDVTSFNLARKIVDDPDKVHLQFDPSFLYDFQPNRKRGRDLIEKYFRVSSKKKIIGLMTTERLRSKYSLTADLKKKYGKEFTFISLGNWDLHAKSYPHITPLEWQEILASLDGVISSFFHGACFSLLGGTPFLAMECSHSDESRSKLHDLCVRIEAEDRYVYGRNNVIHSKQLEHLLDDVRNENRVDYSRYILQAREEFQLFLTQLRNDTASSVQ